MEEIIKNVRKKFRSYDFSLDNRRIGISSRSIFCFLPKSSSWNRGITSNAATINDAVLLITTSCLLEAPPASETVLGTQDNAG